MKHLLSGVAIAAALAIAAPAWAQQMGPKASGGGHIPSSAPPAAAAPMAPMAPKMAGKQRHKRPMRHMAGKKHMGKMSAGDAMTDQLNREELARIQGGGGAMAPATEKAAPFQGARPGPSH
jgi:hypothetical protein